MKDNEPKKAIINGFEDSLKRRYWLFSIPEYYPTGGLRDIDATFNTIEEATQRAATIKEDWGHYIEIFDADTRTFIDLPV